MMELIRYACVNGVALVDNDEPIDSEELRRRACTELLRQAAIDQGLLDANDAPPQRGAISMAASTAIERLLDQQLQSPEPTEEVCRRFYAAHRSRYTVGERVHARHVLFAVTPGVDVNGLRGRAEACLLDLRSCGPQDDRFASVAAQTSNCPTGAQGGDLGWIGESDCAPEFACQLFGKPEIGVLPRLVHSRFGFHVVEVLARDPGSTPAFEVVRSAVVHSLERQHFATSLRQYLQLLAGQAQLDNVDLDAAVTPLVQ